MQDHGLLVWGLSAVQWFRVEGSGFWAQGVFGLKP